MIEPLIKSKEVIELAYAGEIYTPDTAITEADILAAQQRYIAPVVGEDMMTALAAGRYGSLLDDYVLPALAEYVRIECSAVPVVERVRRRAKALLRILSDYLDDNESSYSEYESRENVLNRCNCDGGFVQVF